MPQTGRNFRFLLALLAGCGGPTGQVLAEPVAVQSAAAHFSATPLPERAEQMVVPWTTSKLRIGGKAGKTQEYPLAYRVLYRSGDRFGSQEAGLALDAGGRPLARSAADARQRVGRGPFRFDTPDGNSLLLDAGGRPHLLTQFEYGNTAPVLGSEAASMSVYGLLPGIIQQAELAQEPATGVLSVTSLSRVDGAAEGGIWMPCAATRTAWNTHLGAEEYEPDAAWVETQGGRFPAMQNYLGDPSSGTTASPYLYGHALEIALDGQSGARLTKRYAMGRLSLETAELMPDGRTAYLGDDGAGVARFMFVADRAGDLSVGTLYAAAWQQQSDEGFGSAALQWLWLGHGREAGIRKWVKEGIQFSDIFERASPDEVRTQPGRYRDYRGVLMYTGMRRGSGRLAVEYLRLRPGMAGPAAFLESRRYAAYRGATTEFSKMEGQAVDPRGKVLYTALASVASTMLKGKAVGAQDHIALAGPPSDLSCGAVYQSRLEAGVKDADGRAINSDWVAVDMRPFITGAANPAPGKGGVKGLYACDPERPAGPDNLKFSAALRTLFIAEDTLAHLNNFLWAVNVEDGSAVRIFSAPIGAEVSGPQVVENLNGHAYIMLNVQHPGSAYELKRYPEIISRDLRAKVDQRGLVGYLGGLPSLK